MTERPDEFLDGDDDGEMPWETHARQAIEQAVAGIDFDEIRGVIYLDTDVDQRFNPRKEGFESAEDIRQRLTEIGENEWVAYAPFDGGEPVFGPNVDGFVEDVLERNDVETFFEQVRRPEEGDELASARDLTPPGAGLVLRVDISDINAELVSYLARHPEKMRELNPRKFEELVAELFRDKGYDVELTPRTRDGGLDIRAFHRSDVGTCLTLIECKRYSADKIISVDVVRGLYGVVESERATMGLIATTSFFSSPAKSFQAQNKYRLQLADFENIKTWLSSYRVSAK